tara:strand:+ start:118 stop:285 length:168 start_codon:yes stop_codon:yes gene_type:complete
MIESVHIEEQDNEEDSDLDYNQSRQVSYHNNTQELLRENQYSKAATKETIMEDIS